MQPKDRVPYSAIVDRPPLKLPGGARVAVWTIVNVEEWSIERAMPRTVLPPPYGQPLLPDLPNWAWHEYGMRVGFWRFVEVLSKYKIKATLGHQRLGHQVAIRASPRRRSRRAGNSWGTASSSGRCTTSRISGRPSPTPIKAIKSFTGKRPPRLGEPGPDRDLRHHRLARRGRHRVRRRLGARRPAGEDQDRARADRLGAVHRGDERHRDDGAAAPSVRGMAAPRHRPPSTACTSEGEKTRARDGDQRAPVHHRRAAPHRLPREALRIHPAAAGRRRCGQAKQILDWYLKI